MPASLPYLLVTVKAIHWKNSLLVICKIFGLFLNTLTADDKYSLLDRDKLFQYLQMQLFQKQKTFSQFLLTFCQFRLNFENFQKRDDAIGDVFLNFGAPKNVVR